MTKPLRYEDVPRFEDIAASQTFWLARRDELRAAQQHAELERARDEPGSGWYIALVAGSLLAIGFVLGIVFMVVLMVVRP